MSCFFILSSVKNMAFRNITITLSFIQIHINYVILQKVEEKQEKTKIKFNISFFSPNIARKN